MVNNIADIDQNQMLLKMKNKINVVNLMEDVLHWKRKMKSGKWQKKENEKRKETENQKCKMKN